MLSNINGNIVKNVWYKKFFNVSKGWLSDDEYQKMIDDGTDIVVSSFIPGSNWRGTVWDPIYTKACGFDFDHSAQFFGLLVCKVLIDRDETWYYIKQDVAKGMIYFRPKSKNKGVDDE